MNAQNFTQKSLEALNTAKSMAEESRNSAIARAVLRASRLFCVKF